MIAGLFDGFEALDVATPHVRFRGVVAGTGPPVLLLHGYPETHAAWHAVAPALAVRHTVVVPDVPGYGASRLLVDRAWDKRDVAGELVALMQRLGHDRFAVVGHDRGARVGYRLALDHPSTVTAYCALAVVPVLDVWPAVDREFAKAASHWFWFLLPGELPEKLLAADPHAFLDMTLAEMIGSLDRLHPAALADYRAAFANPAVRAAMIADYRAGYGADTEHDAADRAASRTLACPLLVLWASERLVASGAAEGATAVEIWRRWAADVTGRVISSGHLIPEDAPDEVVRELLPFLAAAHDRGVRPNRR